MIDAERIAHENRSPYKNRSDLYNRGMTTIAVSDARKRFASVLEAAQHEAVILERRGEAQAVVLSPSEYERLLEAVEDAADVSAFDEAMAEEGPNIPWDQVKADLGW